MSKSNLLFAIIKAIAIAVGGTLTLISLMAVAGLVVDNGWARFGIALVVALVIPALVADRVLPGDAKTSDGLVSAAFALIWMGFALLFVGLGSGLTGNMLREQAQDFNAGGKSKLAELTAWVAGPAPAKKIVPAPKPIAATTEPQDAGPTDAAIEIVTKVEDADAAPAVVEVPQKDSYSPAELFKEWSPAVVTIATQMGYQGMGGGTGFIIDNSGVLVTNHHVIEGASAVSVKLLDGKWASKVELLVQDASLDLAILKITTDEDLKVVKMGNSDTIQVGERAISIGNPLGLEHTLTDGVVSARRTIEGKKMIQMSTPISPGNSGGPLFNLRGEVIGVSTASIGGAFGGAQNLNLAIPIDEAKALLKDDYPDRKRIGGGAGSGRGSW